MTTVPNFGKLTLILLLAATALLQGRTLRMTEDDIVGAAMISAEAPGLSWAGTEARSGFFSVARMDLSIDSSLMLRFPVEDIPPGFRVVRAELVIPVVHMHGGSNHNLVIRRMLGPWGFGANYFYRHQLPEKARWERAGATGNLMDRAPTPSASVLVQETGSITVNVTQDVELWYTGAVPNHGWIFAIEEPNRQLGLRAPLDVQRTHASWQLIITYEPDRSGFRGPPRR